MAVQRPGAARAARPPARGGAGGTDLRLASQERVARIGRLGRVGRWPEALAFLTSPGTLPLDVYALGAIVRACEQHGQWLAALGAIDVARQGSVQANVVVCNTAISACAKGQQWQWSLELLQGMARQDLQVDVISYSSLVSGYAQARHWAEALEVLGRMAEEPSLPSPNGMTFSAAISACCEEQTWPRALGLLEEMQMQGLEADVVVQTAILSALSFGGHWETSLHLAAALSQQQPLTLTTTNVLATSLQRCAQWSLVLALLQQMEQGRGLAEKCTADGITYAAAIAACGAGGCWQDALDLWSKGPQNAILLNVAINACGDNLQWRGALQLLSNELSDTVSYNSAITACGTAWHWQHALALFEEMPQKVLVDLVTYNALISAMSPARQWLRALALLAALAAASALRPSVVTYNAAVAAMEPWSARAMSVLDTLRWQNFSMSYDEAISTEGKQGVPRFAGEAAKLSEYSYRVRLMQAKEKNIDSEEIKKLGPLALRLVNGLRGPALQVARNLPIDELLKDKGTDFLLAQLQQSLRPRSKQEARELYQAGAQTGGILSRQHGESIPSYVLRRKAWHAMMVDLDQDLKLPDGILSEQLLQNAGLSEDHKLLVRTAIQGDMTWSKVCEELVAQHSRIHERETNKGKGYKGTGKHAFKGYKSSGKSKTWKSYHVDAGEDPNSDAWENASQSLGGYEDLEDAAYYTYEKAENYDEEDPIFQAFQAMIDEGLDEEDQEAIDHAAEVLQAESEVYYVRQRARDTGHNGFWTQGKNFQVSGNLTLEEKRARIQAMKAKTQCRKCGQYGHWSDDVACPRNARKGGGKPKGASSTTSTTASSKGKSKGGRAGNDKPRTVYFAINEYSENKDYEATSYMALRGVTTPDGESADEQLDRMIAEAQVREATGYGRPQQLEDQHAALVARQPAPGGFSWAPSNPRLAYLDHYLANYNNPTDPEWQDAYQERWSEFRPGHPLFSEQDRINIARWQNKAAHGLPRIPEVAIPEPGADLALTPAEETLHRMLEDQERREIEDCLTVLEEEYLAKTETMKTEDARNCKHDEKDFRGSTGTKWQWTCKKCGHKESGAKSVGQSAREAASSAGSVHEASSVSSRSSGNLRFSPASSAAGSQEDNQVDQIMHLVNHVVDIQRELGHPMSLNQLDKIYDKCRKSVLDRWGRQGSTSSTSQERSRSGSVQPSPSVAASAAPTSAASDNPRDQDLQLLQSGVHRGLTFAAVFQNEVTYTSAMIGKLRSGALKDPELIRFATYAQRRKATPPDTPSSGYSPSPAAYAVNFDIPDGDDMVVAVLDTGCNNTCHGDRWAHKLHAMNGSLPEAEPADGKFKGVGGRVEVTCKRTITMRLKTLDGDLVPGTITSIELANSDAPLLLSSVAQKKLGLVIDMGHHTAYSRTLDKELELVDYNGLPAVRLHPGDLRPGSVALNVMEEHEVIEIDSTDDEDKTEVNHMPVIEGNLKVLNKKQKKHLQDSLHDMEKEDCALWSTLINENKRPNRMLPRGCKTFLLEMFAGAATLSLMAVHLGLTVSSPIDVIYDPRYDLTKKANRDAIDKLIQDDDPFLLAMSPVCGPWSPWQNVNLSKSEDTYNKIMEDRKRWYPVLKWLAEKVKERVRKGREVILENPWPSLLWKLKFMEDLYTDPIYHPVTNEPVELCRLDQCMYGLYGESGLPHQKATGMLLSSNEMKKLLQTRCDGTHDHEQLEGGQRTKRAQQWPEDLCMAIVYGAMEEMRKQVMQIGFAAEYEQEEMQEHGPLDGIHTLDDVEEPAAKRQRIDLEELDREEDYLGEI
eukprot:s65_g3.t1